MIRCTGCACQGRGFAQRRRFWRPCGAAALLGGAGGSKRRRRCVGTEPALARSSASFPSQRIWQVAAAAATTLFYSSLGGPATRGQEARVARCQVALGTHRGALREDHGATGRARRPTRRREVASLPGDMRGSLRDPLGLAMLRTGSTSQPRGCLPRPSRRGATFSALPPPTPRSPATLSFKAPTRSVRRHSILRSALPPQRLSSMHGAPACVGYGASCA